MKALLTVLSLGWAILAVAGQPKVVSVGLTRSFVPIGFDDNDKVQVVVQGIFNNTCYKVGPYLTQIDEVKKTVMIEQRAYQYPGVCLQMIVPFSQVIDLGILREGNYMLTDRFSTKGLGRLPVTRASNPGPDDYLYAPVAEATIRHEGSEHVLTLSGSFSDRCTVMKEIRVQYFDDVLIVQPIAERTVSEGTVCTTQTIRYLHSVPLKPILKGAYLLHVRSMDGQAVNKIVDFE